MVVLIFISECRLLHYSESCTSCRLGIWHWWTRFLLWWTDQYRGELLHIRHIFIMYDSHLKTNVIILFHGWILQMIHHPAHASELVITFGMTVIYFIWPFIHSFIFLYFPSILYTRYGKRHVHNTNSYRNIYLKKIKNKKNIYSSIRCCGKYITNMCY